jgi:hypothetical protein
MSEAQSTAVVPSAKAAKKSAKKSAAKPKAKKAKGNGGWATKYREGTIGRTIADHIVAAKLDNNEILESVKKQHKGCQTTYACITWYRSKHNAEVK